MEYPTTMTALLREALLEAPSMLGVEKATGVKRQTLMKFRDEKQSLRLDMAEKLAVYFGIRCERARRSKAGNSERK